MYSSSRFPSFSWCSEGKLWICSSLFFTNQVQKEEAVWFDREKFINDYLVYINHSNIYLEMWNLLKYAYNMRSKLNNYWSFALTLGMVLLQEKGHRFYRIPKHSGMFLLLWEAVASRAMFISLTYFILHWTGISVSCKEMFTWYQSDFHAAASSPQLPVMALCLFTSHH